MDIKEIINSIVEKVKSDDQFAQKFKKDPVKAITSLTGINVPEDQIDKVVDGIKAKLNMDKADGLLGGIKKMF